jgi:hypothetical protein
LGGFLAGRANTVRDAAYDMCGGEIVDREIADVQ